MAPRSASTSIRERRHTVTIGAGVSTHQNAAAAAAEATSAALEAHQGEEVDLAVTFFTAGHSARSAEIANTINAESRPSVLLGCTTETVIGGGQELENTAAVAVWLARLGGAQLTPFSVAVDVQDRQTLVSGLPVLSDAERRSNSLPPLPEPLRAVLLLADPLTFPAFLIEKINQDRPGLPIIGGMASGGRMPGSHVLLMGGRPQNAGAVGVLISGDVVVDPLVSQGCRPIGRPYVVTESSGPTVMSLGGKEPLMRLTEAVVDLPQEERELVTHGLHVGIAADEYREKFDAGDFVIRNLRGVDQDSGAIVVGDNVDVGQTIQFQVRDAEAATDDLRNTLLKRNTAYHSAKLEPAGALMFTCNGRGSRLFGRPDHDIKGLEMVLGRIPSVGMFCNGEIGPVGARNFIHGFTASIAVFAEGPRANG